MFSLPVYLRATGGHYYTYFLFTFFNMFVLLCLLRVNKFGCLIDFTIAYLFISNRGTGRAIRHPLNLQGCCAPAPLYTPLNLIKPTIRT